MKGFRKRLSALLVTAAMTAAVVVPAAAAGTDYDAITPKDATFTKYLLVDQTAVAPSATFSYTVEKPESAIAGTSTTLPVYIGTGTPVIADVAFAPSDTAETSTLLTNYKTYKKTITIDLDTAANGVQFKEPGVYRYYIKEADSAVAGMYCDVSTTALTTEGDLYRTLDIYVEDNGTDATSGNKILKVTGYIMYDGKITAAPPSSTSATSGNAINTTKQIEVNSSATDGVSGAAKTDNYINYYTSQSITIGKTVTGNQGSRDKYFKFTLKLTSPVDSKLSVDVSNADASVPAAANLNKATKAAYAGIANPTTIDLTAATEVSTDFYLQHGQYIIVNGLPVGTTYALIEDAEDYTSTAGIAQAVSAINWDGAAGNDALSDAVTGTIAVDDNDSSTTGDGDIHTGFTNDKQGVIPTGVLLTMTPVIVVAVIVVAGIAFFTVRNAKRKALELADADDESDAE